MFERIPRLRAVLEEKKHDHHRRLIELAVQHQLPVVRMIRDGFPEPTRSEVIELETRKQGLASAALSNVAVNVDGDPVSRFMYGKHLLELPAKPAFDMLAFAREFGTAYDSMPREELLAANPPSPAFTQHNGVFISLFTLKCVSRLAMGMLLRGAAPLMQDYFTLQAMQKLRDGNGDGRAAIESELRGAGIDTASISHGADGTASFSQKGCRRTLNLDRRVGDALDGIYSRYLNPVAKRVAFAFSPEI